MNIIESKYLFTTYYYNLINPKYKISVVPGIKEGISGSTIQGYNIGIYKYSKKSNLNAAVEALKFITTKEIQKECILKKKIISAIPSLYDDKEICSSLDCNLFKNIQPIGKPYMNVSEYNSYSNYFRKNIFDFLFENKDINEVLEKIEDYTKIYYISINSDDTNIGLISIIIIFGISTIMIISLIFLFIERYKSYYNFLSTDFWIITILGLLLYNISCLTEMGEKKIIKCHLKLIIISFGNTFTLIPVFHKLIINFPIKNRFSEWVKKNKYIFLFIFIIFDIILILITLIYPIYFIDEKEITNGKNFNICNINNVFSNIILLITVILKLVILLIFIILIYIEWNMETTYYDLRFLILSIHTNILFLIVIVIFNKIQINDYIYYFIIDEITNFCFNNKLCLFIWNKNYLGIDE